VTAQRVMHLSFRQEGCELFPNGLDDVRWDRGHRNTLLVSFGKFGSSPNDRASGARYPIDASRPYPRSLLVIQDRQSRFVVAHASGRRTEALAPEAIQKAHARSQGQRVGWCSDGWRTYPKATTKAYREPARTGRRGRSPLIVPEGVSLTQTIKRRNEHGRLLSVEIRAILSALLQWSSR
jgi:hypothetical protein